MSLKTIQAIQILGITETCDQAQVKALYKKLAQKYHPDRNPAGLEMMKLINEAYNVLKDLSIVEMETSEAPSLNDYPEELSAAINKIITLGMNIEICGLWVWVSGDTKQHKDVLKEANFKWAHKKLMWYFRPEEEKKTYYARSFNISEIREKYGSQSVKRKNYKKLAV